MPRKQNLFQKINAVRREVGYIKKDVKIKGGGSYMAVSHDAVTAQVRESLIKHNLIIAPPSVIESKVVDTGMVTASGTPVIRYEAKYQITIIDGGNPPEGEQEHQYLESVVEAHANDTGDKAPGKAMSYATKYFMLKMFNLETGEDEEGRIATADQGKPIGTGEYIKIEGLIGDIKKAGAFDEAEFIAYLKARGMVGEKLTDITQGLYPVALHALQKKLELVKEERGQIKEAVDG